MPWKCFPCREVWGREDAGRCPCQHPQVPAGAIFGHRGLSRSVKSNVVYLLPGLRSWTWKCPYLLTSQSSYKGWNWRRVLSGILTYPSGYQCWLVPATSFCNESFRLRCKYGKIERLSIDIPWTSVFNKPTKVEVFEWSPFTVRLSILTFKAKNKVW